MLKFKKSGLKQKKGGLSPKKTAKRPSVPADMNARRVALKKKYKA